MFILVLIVGERAVARITHRESFTPLRLPRTYSVAQIIHFANNANKTNAEKRNG